MECSNSGVAHSSHSSHGENCLERREKERRKRESWGDQRTVSQVLARSLNSTEGGSGPRILETTGKLQILDPIVIPSTEEGSPNLAKGNLVYVGITSHLSHRLGVDEDERKKRKQN